MSFIEYPPDDESQHSDRHPKPNGHKRGGANGHGANGHGDESAASASDDTSCEDDESDDTSCAGDESAASASDDTTCEGDESAALEPLFGDDLPIGVALGTELATAHLLHQHHGLDLIYSAELDWGAYDGRRFAASGTVDPSRRVQNVGRRLELGVAELLRRRATTKKKDKRARLKADAKELAKWAKNVQTASGVRHALELAQTLVHVRPDELDTDPMLLNVTNGTIELSNGTLREHRRADKITRLAPVVYDPQATAPRWETFLCEILPDADVRAFVLRYLGYSLTGLVSEHALAIALGDGANGKSVLAEIVRRLLGDHARDTPTDTLMHSKHGTRGTENDIARLKGCRFVTLKELEQGRRLDEARVKALTGGDTVTARFLYREWFEFIPTFKIWMYCNHRPVIRGVDAGIWRRVNLVPFNVTIAADKRDPNLGEKLWAEAPGILASLVRACLEWQRIGLQPPAAVRAATDRWRDESDDVREFIADVCVVGPRYSVNAGPLYEKYNAWVQEQGGSKEPLSKTAFGERLGGLGYAPDRTGRRGRFWRGIGLQAEPDREPGLPSDSEGRS